MYLMVIFGLIGFNWGLLENMELTDWVGWRANELYASIPHDQQTPPLRWQMHSPAPRFQKGSFSTRISCWPQTHRNQPSKTLSGRVTILGILPRALTWYGTHYPSQPSLAIEMFAKVVIRRLALAFLAEQCPPAHTATSFVFSGFSSCVLECVCVDICTPPRRSFPQKTEEGVRPGDGFIGNRELPGWGTRLVSCARAEMLFTPEHLQGLCLVYPSQRCRYYQQSLQVWRLNDREKLVGFRFFCSLEIFY